MCDIESIGVRHGSGSAPFVSRGGCLYYEGLMIKRKIVEEEVKGKR